MAQFGVGVDSRSYAVTLSTLFDRVLPTLNETARLELWLARFVESLLDDLREKKRIVIAGLAIDVFTLAEVEKQLNDHDVAAF
ncbi:unnamed protein product [Echinostoma caproni]|uniref:Transcriptional regulator n=1 Tax=Echinostoma caproni TaxID=27848 RepID=A0A183ADK2_9TREM|nr:unnamed protein product [Echinostoma caproni]